MHFCCGLFLFVVSVVLFFCFLCYFFAIRRGITWEAEGLLHFFASIQHSFRVEKEATFSLLWSRFRLLFDLLLLLSFMFLLNHRGTFLLLWSLFMCCSICCCFFRFFFFVKSQGNVFIAVISFFFLSLICCCFFVSFLVNNSLLPIGLLLICCLLPFLFFFFHHRGITWKPKACTGEPSTCALGYSVRTTWT